VETSTRLSAEQAAEAQPPEPSVSPVLRGPGGLHGRHGGFGVLMDKTDNTRADQVWDDFEKTVVQFIRSLVRRALIMGLLGGFAMSIIVHLVIWLYNK
jgi:hypothetical protein